MVARRFVVRREDSSFDVNYDPEDGFEVNGRVASEYDDLGDVAAGLRVFAEQMKSKSGGLDEFVGQMDSIEKQVSEFEAMISVLDRYVSVLESRIQTEYRHRYRRSNDSAVTD